MTDIRTAILARINQGPANAIDLHGSCMRQCQIAESGAAALWGYVHSHCAELVAEGVIRLDPAGCWTVPNGLAYEKSEAPSANSLRPGTSVPGNFKHLVPTRK